MDTDDIVIKPIITTDDPRLKEVSLPVTEFNKDLSDLIQDMVQSMVDSQGVGLSAVQIGVMKRVIIAYDDNAIHVLINPEFVRKLNRFTIEEEGCLSIPGKRVKVSRPAKCEVKFQNLIGLFHTVNYSGMLARIIQHEIDHLDGILITDKV